MAVSDGVSGRMPHVDEASSFLSLVEAVVMGHRPLRMAWTRVAMGTGDTLNEVRLALAAPLKEPVWVDGTEAPLLHHAAGRGDDWALGLLLSLGAPAHQPDPKGALAVEWAVRGKHWTSFLRLWSYGLPERAPIAAPTLVHAAVQAGREYLSSLGQRGLTWAVSLWDGWDDLGRRPLHCAADANDHEAAGLLVAMGARPQAHDGQRRTPCARHADRYPSAADRFEAAVLQQPWHPPTPPAPSGGFSGLARRRGVT